MRKLWVVVREADGDRVVVVVVRRLSTQKLGRAVDSE